MSQFNCQTLFRLSLLIVIKLLILNTVLTHCSPLYTERIFRNMGHQITIEEILNSGSRPNSLSEDSGDRCKTSREIKNLCERCTIQSHNPKTYEYCCANTEDSLTFCKKFVEFNYVEMRN